MELTLKTFIQKGSSLNIALVGKKQCGFSLIEIMVAALVLSMGILGVVSLQIVGLKGTQQSHMKYQAMSVVQNLTERMRSNKQGVLAGHYVTASNSFDCAQTALPDCSTTNCDSQDIANVDLHNLICGYKLTGSPRTNGIKTLSTNDVNTFVDGELSIACTNTIGCSTGDIKVEVKWRERAIGKEQQGAKDSLLINTRISL